MLVGHAGIALAAKAAEPRSNLGTLFFATMAVDIIGCVLELAGMSAPYAAAIAHSLSISILLAAFFFVLWIAWAGKKAMRAAALLAFVAFSHWPLDWLVHEPDLPLVWLDGPRVGFGLWRTPSLAVAVELGIAAVGLGAYVLRTSASRQRRWFVAALTAIAAVPSVIAAYAQQAHYQMSPTAEVGLAAGGLATILVFVAAAAWAERP